MANNPEDLAWVGDLLDRHPNAHIDLSARIDELGRQPYTARDFFTKYQDRPDYLGQWGHCRWKIYGLDLVDQVLRRVYYENAARLIPSTAP